VGGARAVLAFARCICIALTLFFAALNLLEAMLPALVSKYATRKRAAPHRRQLERAVPGRVRRRGDRRAGWPSMRATPPSSLLSSR
jgi:hypothetical protein